MGRLTRLRARNPEEYPWITMKRVVVIGGGATGVGILRDLALRGIPAILLERQDLAGGASGRNHGLLHSGGRYAVTDPVSARECIEENAVLRRIAPWAVEACGGLFVQLRRDDPSYTQEWERACLAAGIQVEEISATEARRIEPALGDDVVRVFRSPDAGLDPFRLVVSTADAARTLGAEVHTRVAVTGLVTDSGGVRGVRAVDLASGDEWLLESELVINAAGAWAGNIAAMAGIQMDMVADRGALIVFNGRVSERVINRLRPPGDADILVPAGTVSILGTTAVMTADPDNTTVLPDEVEHVLRLGAEMVPAVRWARRLRAFVGVRPLFHSGVSSDSGGNQTRELSRNFAVLDHFRRDGVRGIISVVGGKLTIHRLMAEKTVDLALVHLGMKAPCRTANEPILPPPDRALAERVEAALGEGRGRRVIDRHLCRLTNLEKGFASSGGKVVLCECEDVTAAEILETARELRSGNLSDLRRRTRLGMGTCQGAFCGYRAVGLLHAGGIVFVSSAQESLRDFLNERWHGNRLTLGGDQLREAELAYGIYACNLGLRRSMGGERGGER